MTVTTYWSPLTGTPVPTLPKGPVDIPADNRALVDKLETFTIPRFATVAARDAAIPTPVAGQVVYITADDSLYKSTGANWVRLKQDNDVQRKILGIATNTTDITSSTVGSWEQAVPNPGSALSVIIPANVPSDMRLRLDANLQIATTPIGLTSAWFMADGSMLGGPGISRLQNPVADRTFYACFAYTMSVPSAGTHTYSIRIRNELAATWIHAWGQLTVSLV